MSPPPAVAPPSELPCLSRSGSKKRRNEDGGILYNVSCDQRVWDVVKIDCRSMEEVLQDSYIVNIS